MLSIVRDDKPKDYKSSIHSWNDKETGGYFSFPNFVRRGAWDRIYLDILTDVLSYQIMPKNGSKGRACSASQIAKCYRYRKEDVLKAFARLASEKILIAVGIGPYKCTLWEVAPVECWPRELKISSQRNRFEASKNENRFPKEPSNSSRRNRFGSEIGSSRNRKERTLRKKKEGTGTTPSADASSPPLFFKPVEFLTAYYEAVGRSDYKPPKKLTSEQKEDCKRVFEACQGDPVKLKRAAEAYKQQRKGKLSFHWFACGIDDWLTCEPKPVTETKWL